MGFFPIQNISCFYHVVILVLNNCSNGQKIKSKGIAYLKLQKMQNAGAKLVVKGKMNYSITSVLIELHWLKIEETIVSKLLLLVLKCLNGLCSNNFETFHVTSQYTEFEKRRAI